MENKFCLTEIWSFVRSIHAIPSQMVILRTLDEFVLINTEFGVGVAFFFVTFACHLIAPVLLAFFVTRYFFFL